MRTNLGHLARVAVLTGAACCGGAGDGLSERAAAAESAFTETRTTSLVVAELAGIHPTVELLPCLVERVRQSNGEPVVACGLISDLDEGSLCVWRRQQDMDASLSRAEVFSAEDRIMSDDEHQLGAVTLQTGSNIAGRTMEAFVAGMAAADVHETAMEQSFRENHIDAVLDTLAYPLFMNVALDALPKWLSFDGRVDRVLVEGQLQKSGAMRALAHHVLVSQLTEQDKNWLSIDGYRSNRLLVAEGDLLARDSGAFGEAFSERYRVALRTALLDAGFVPLSESWEGGSGLP